MNCWFCNSQIDESTLYHQNISCTSPTCHSYNVVYKFNNIYSLIVVQLKTKLNNHNYIANYWVDLKRIVIVEQVLANFINNMKDPYSYESVLNIPCERLIITPQNINSKLPLLILLS